MVVTAVLDEEKASSETEKPARRKRLLAHHSLAHKAAAAIMVATTAVALVCVLRLPRRHTPRSTRVHPRELQTNHIAMLRI